MKSFLLSAIALLFAGVLFTENIQAQCFVTTSQQNVTCNGLCNGSATATVWFGGFGTHQYSWNTTPVQTTQTATNLCAGTYTVTVVAANGCTATDQVTITQPAPIVVTIDKTDVTCYGGTNGSATANVTGGTGNITYSWNTTPVQTTQTATNLTAGTYTVTVTRNNCQKTASVTITQPPQITGSVSSTPADCGMSNGTATAQATGGTGTLSYSWNTNPVQTTQTATGLASGVYTITVTDQNNCSQSANVTVGNVGGPTVTIEATGVTCAGGNNGSATATPDDGTAPYSYSWNTNPVQTTQTAVNLSEGTYTVVVTDANNCTGTASVTITQASSLVVTAEFTNPTCFNSANGTATATATGGNPPYWYAWNTSPVTIAQSVSGLPAGTYTVTATDNFGCTATATVTLTQPPLLTTSITHENVSCNEANDGTATVNVSGGTPPFSFSWNTNPVQTTQTATGLGPGNYTATTTDSKGCISTAGVTITEPAAINLSTSSTNTPCGQTTGTATATASGGVGTLSYSWNTTPVQTTATATGLGAGTYTVTVTDESGCSVSASATVVSPGGPSATTTHTNVSCNGGNNGTATVNATGGTTPYTYLWQPGGATTQTAFGLAAGTYSVTVTDQAGCTVIATAIITQPQPLNVNVSSVNILCNGQTTGSATATATGGVPAYSYSWNTNPVETTAAIANLDAGDYVVTVTDINGCTANATATITEPDELTATTVQTHVSCNGGNNGASTVTPQGGTVPYTYAWNTNPVQTTQTATNLASGNYSVVVTDTNGCTVTKNVTINEPTPIDLYPSSTAEDCGQTNGTATVIADGGAGGYSYSWNTNPVQTTETASGLASGTYTVTVTDANGCTDSATVSVPNAGGLFAEAVGTNISCFGGDNGTVTLNASGGTQPYSFSWNTNPVATTQSVTNLTAGTYTGTVTDNDGCQFSSTITITQPPAFTVNATHENILCNGQATGTATANPSGGVLPYQYSWDTQPSQTTQSISSLTAGSYTVVVTDANGCEASATVNITQPASPLNATTLQTHISCNGGSNGASTANPTGGTAPYTYSWNTVPTQTTQTAFGLPAGNYTVVITDANGCTVSKNVTLTQPPAIAATFTVDDASCGQADGSITADVSGGVGNYTYTWNTNPAQTTETATGLAANIYTLTITDGNNCVKNFNVTVNNEGSATLNISGTNVSCNGGNNGTATVVATGGTPEYSYSWNTNPVQTTASATGLAAGDYTVTVTDDASCISLATITVTQPSALNVTAQGTNPSCDICPDGSATAIVSGGTAPYTYEWNDPQGQTTATASDLVEGTYTVTVTDFNGCTETASVTITALVTGITVINESSLVIYPNPVSDFITVDLETNIPTQITIRVSDMTGRIMAEKNTNANGFYREQFDFGNFAPGLYFVIAESRTEKFVRKVVKR